MKSFPDVTDDLSGPDIAHWNLLDVNINVLSQTSHSQPL